VAEKDRVVVAVPDDVGDLVNEGVPVSVRERVPDSDEPEDGVADGVGEQDGSAVRPVVWQALGQEHGKGTLIPFEGQKNAIGHGTHALMLDAPIKGLYVPPTQAVIALEAVVQNDPDGHASKYATIVMPGFIIDESVKSFATSGPPHSE
jgi:hypothetical protein